ncbi:hypothetical protein AXG93_2402s1410 [Marchantia polymorpha subsp. ruderalis]|uniref:Uncharacterized protein n=1 Tax=Marchantia polymorpha subsp. ruderalis TaxID=1480154 RepID=A0A176VUW4_MARPO|nr:hypothetical protein AXG93_2402s1410 [Marchantia polymorpha subsp. ruderalis]
MASSLQHAIIENLSRRGRQAKVVELDPDLSTLVLVWGIQKWKGFRTGKLISALFGACEAGPMEDFAKKFCSAHWEQKLPSIRAVGIVVTGFSPRRLTSSSPLVLPSAGHLSINAIFRKASVSQADVNREPSFSSSTKTTATTQDQELKQPSPDLSIDLTVHLS